MSTVFESSCYPMLFELIHLPLFRECRVIAGEKGLKRLVKGVNLSENPDFYRFISGGEIIITTGYSFYQNPHAIRDFVPRLARKNIAGICIKPVRYLKEVPNEMIDAANREGIPLIVLSENLSFGEIIRAVYEEILIRQTSILRNSIEVNEMLSSTIINGAGLPEIVQMLSELTYNSILILDTVNDRREYKLRARDATLWAGCTPDEICQKMRRDSSVYQLDAGNHSFGLLYMRGEDLSDVLNEELFSKILRTIPLEISREQVKREATQQDFSNFLLHLLSNSGRHENLDMSRAESFGLNLAKEQMILRIRVIKRDVDKENPYLGIFEKTVFMAGLRDIFAARDIFAHIVSTTFGHIVFLSAQSSGPQLVKFEASAAEILNPLLAGLSALSITIGCGRIYHGVQGFSLSNREADIALMAASERNQYQVLSFSKLGIMRLICAENAEKEAQNFLWEILGGILTDKKREDLLKTIESYFKNLGNIKWIAQDIFVHYNTAVYRIKDIQRKSGCDLSNSEDRFRLELAFRLYQSIGHQEMPDTRK